MIKAKGYANKSATQPLEPFQFERRDIGTHDVQLQILYCGICHTDLHIARNEWNNTTYPCVPGHEIVGKVTAVGKEVKSFKVGDLAAIGCMVNSCKRCGSCQEGFEQYCDNANELVFTYNSPEKETNSVTHGGYSNCIIANENFVLHVPKSLDLKAVAPLLCAGITTYSPLSHWKVKQGDTVGVVGLGGLGHMAVKIAHAMGATVTVITTSKHKEQDAKRLGATNILFSTNSEQMAHYANHFDLIINTIPRTHDVNPYLNLLKRDGTMVIVGAIEPLKNGIDARTLIFKRRQLAGSLIGGIKETQEMLDFCAKHNVLPDVEMIAIQDINQAYERLLNNNVKYRFVIDMASLE